MNFLTLKQNKAFNDKFERYFSSIFDTKISQQKRKTMKSENTGVFALLLLY